MIEIEFYSEICCDTCYDVIHNHMHCPACGNDYAGTNVYCSMQEAVEDEDHLIVECQECKAQFKNVDKEYPYKWERL